MEKSFIVTIQGNTVFGDNFSMTYTHYCEFAVDAVLGAGANIPVALTEVTVTVDRAYRDEE